MKVTTAILDNYFEPENVALAARFEITEGQQNSVLLRAYLNEQGSALTNTESMRRLARAINESLGEPEMFYVDVPDMFRIGIPIADSDEREQALINLRWVLGCWQHAIESSYTDGAPRRLEVDSKIRAIGEGIKYNLSEDEWRQFAKGFRDDLFTV